MSTALFFYVKNWGKHGQGEVELINQPQRWIDIDQLMNRMKETKKTTVNNVGNQRKISNKGL